MRRVTGIGGIFLKSKDSEALYSWYEKHLGIKHDPHGAVFMWRDAEQPEKPGSTAWSIFSHESKYFEPTSSPNFMVNYRVENLEALLEALREEGVWIDDKRDNSFGRFAWIRDCDGNRIELWEPPEGT